MTVDEDFEGDKRRAEVFDALSHPTRIVILKALGEGAMGFADLKKKTGIDSSGHLQHHLSKLGPLVKTGEYGKYCLNEQGIDALHTVQTVENAAAGSKESLIKHGSGWMGKKPFVRTVAVAFAILLVASVALNVYELNQTASMQNQISQLDVGVSQMEDISQIQVVKSTPNVGMNFLLPGLFLVGNDTVNMKPYSFWVAISVQIRNPTGRNVTLKLQGELNLTLSGQESGVRVWNETRYFSVPMSSDNTYRLSLYEGEKYADPNAVRAVVNSYEVYVVSGHILNE